MKSFTLGVWERSTTFEEWQKVYADLLFVMYLAWLKEVSRITGIWMADIPGEYENLSLYHYKQSGPGPPDSSNSYPVPEGMGDKSIKWPGFAKTFEEVYGDGEVDLPAWWIYRPYP